MSLMFRLVFVDRNDSHLSHLGDATHNPQRPLIQGQSYNFIRPIARPRATHVAVEQHIFHIVYIEPVILGFRIGMLGQIIEPVSHQGPNLSNLTHATTLMLRCASSSIHGEG